MTTPLTLWVYPKRFRVHASAVATEGQLSGRGEEHAITGTSGGHEFKTRFAVVLDKIEQLPAVMTIMQLLQPASSSASSLDPSSVNEKSPAGTALATQQLYAPLPEKITVDALRLVELTERTSAVFKSQHADAVLRSDPATAVFRTYGHLNDITVSTVLKVVPSEEFPGVIRGHIGDRGSEMVILPWARTSGAEETETNNPFDGVFKSGDQTGSVIYSNFIRKALLDVTVDAALFVDRGVGASVASSGRRHLFLPFFGGPDDRLALSFVVQLCANPLVSATVVRIQKTALAPVQSLDTIEHEKEAAINNVSLFH